MNGQTAAMALFMLYSGYDQIYGREPVFTETGVSIDLRPKVPDRVFGRNLDPGVDFVGYDANGRPLGAEALQRRSLCP